MIFIYCFDTKVIKPVCHCDVLMCWPAGSIVLIVLLFCMQSQAAAGLNRGINASAQGRFLIKKIPNPAIGDLEFN